MALTETAHRPWPLPAGSWALSMRWLDLLFMHWPVPARALRPLLPSDLALDTFDGTAWLGVVPFRMARVRPRFLPAVPGLSAFPELNVRTYVTHQDKPGVWFFSLDAANRIAVRLARTTFHLPYLDARMTCRTDADGTTTYSSRRTDRTAAAAAFEARYRPSGAAFRATPGTLAHWLTERYTLYSADDQGRIYRGDIHHAMWPLQPAEADVRLNTMTDPLGLALPDVPPLLHFARRLDVVAWRIRRVSA